MPQQSEPGYDDYGEDDILIGPYGYSLVIQTLLEIWAMRSRHRKSAI